MLQACPIFAGHLGARASSLPSSSSLANAAFQTSATGTRKPFMHARNLQLDFFRGIALMVIFINHTPENPWFYYTPSRFGLSDAAEIFVFLSGFAAALVYGRCFQYAGLWLGCVRVLHRCWQIYTSHLASFFLLATLCVLGNKGMAGMDYIHRLNIQYFFDNTQAAVLELFTLQYVPNYFDILPMYMVLMLCVPLFWAISRIRPGLALLCSALVYAASGAFAWELQADAVTGRPWFFNPFAWQFMFFTGFAFGAGWLRPPPPSRRFAGLCLLFVLLSIPLGHIYLYQRLEFWGMLRTYLEPWLDKSHLGILRWLHFLALAYLMNQWFKRHSDWLHLPPLQWVSQMGRRSLPIFLLSMCLSYLAGMALDQGGHEAVNAVWVNLAGLSAMLLAAQALAWLEAKPWKTAGYFESSPIGGDAA
jgi:hypothetical protein